VDSLCCFFAEEGFLFLKRGYLPFLSTKDMPEPWLYSDCAYVREESSANVSAQDYRRFLQQQYKNLPQTLKDLMDFDYFEQQSEVKREQIEQTLIEQRHQSDAIAPFSAERLQDWRILSLYESWQDLQLWHLAANKGEGLVIEFALEKSGFQTQGYSEQHQHLAKINAVDAWLPDDALYYLFNRPQQGGQEYNEWRLARPLSSADRHVSVNKVSKAMYRLPNKAVKRIILGYRCSQEYCQQVKHYLSQDINYRHVECVQAQLDPKTLCLQLVAIGG
jgi:hypothetical protein